MDYDHQIKQRLSTPPPPLPERSPLRKQHKLSQRSLQQRGSDNSECIEATRKSSPSNLGYPNSMLSPCNVVSGLNACCSNSGLSPNTPNIDPEPALSGVFPPGQYTLSGTGQCAQPNSPTTTHQFHCLEGSSDSTMIYSNLNGHAGHFSEADESQSCVSANVSESSHFIPETPCIAQGPFDIPATSASPSRRIRRKTASPDLRAEYLRSASPPYHAPFNDTTTDLTMKSALGAGLGLGITLNSEAKSSDTLFDDSVTITPMTISISTHMMDRISNRSDRTVVPATPMKRTTASRSFFSVSSSPPSPPIIVVSHTESQSKPDEVISPKVASKPKSKSKSKVQSEATKKGGKKQTGKGEESKQILGYASPPLLAPQLVRTRSGYSRSH